MNKTWECKSSGKGKSRRLGLLSTKLVTSELTAEERNNNNNNNNNNLYIEMSIVLYIGCTLPVFGFILVIIGKTRKDINCLSADLNSPYPN